MMFDLLLTTGVPALGIIALAVVYLVSKDADLRGRAWSLLKLLLRRLTIRASSHRQIRASAGPFGSASDRMQNIQFDVMRASRLGVTNLPSKSATRAVAASGS